jgi:hypothetical protein
MCRTYVDGVGYVCAECQSEFKDYLSSKGIVVESEGEIKRQLKKFMESEKDEYTKGRNMDIDEFFNEYRRND